MHAVKQDNSKLRKAASPLGVGLLGSLMLLGLGSMASAQSKSDAVEAEPVEYVRVCDAYGAGFFFIPGTETCLKVDGYIRILHGFGEDPGTGAELKTWYVRNQTKLRFDARTETELGTLRSFIEPEFNYTNGDNIFKQLTAYIELGGFRIGVADEIFGTWTGDAGGVVIDDVINYQSGYSNQISYTYDNGKGFSAMIGAEQGSGSYDRIVGINPLTGAPVIDSTPYEIDGYTPHILGGLKYKQEWGGISAVAGYDSKQEEWAAKVRLDLKFNQIVSAFVMVGYQSDGDTTKFGPTFFKKPNWFAQWNGDYAVWGGVSSFISTKAMVNLQVAYESAGTTSASLNLLYRPVPNLTVGPEFVYTSYGDSNRGFGKDHSFGGLLGIQMDF
ncbi:porin [Phyllobacterium sp. TAF24]|uniref:porin n=1 Tax=Phyllobacterium sp. TAF24 TaxID=3233068 RepID=UPI003F9D7BF1